MGRKNRERQATDKRPKISEIDEESLVPFSLKDLKVIECPICCEIWRSPLYQCKNGHTVCSSCYTKLGKKCPTCSHRIGNMRNRDLESLMESLLLSCLNKKFGCMEILDSNKWKEHQESCVYAACACPHPKCSFVSSSKELSLHFSSDHNDSATIFTYEKTFSLIFSVFDKQVILQERNDGALFLLESSGAGENVGSLVSVRRIAPKSCKLACDYKLTCHSERTIGNSVALHSVTENCAGRDLPRSPSMESLLVPAGFLGPSLVMELIVRVGKKKPSPDLTSP